MASSPRRGRSNCAFSIPLLCQLSKKKVLAVVDQRYWIELLDVVDYLHRYGITNADGSASEKITGGLVSHLEDIGLFKQSGDLAGHRRLEHVELSDRLALLRDQNLLAADHV